jgi:signal peptidase I
MIRVGLVPRGGLAAWIRVRTKALPLQLSLRLGRPTRRTLMDAKQRPSHSRMYDANGNYIGVQQQQLSSEPILMSHGSYLRLLATRALQAGCLVYCITEYVADITLCEGPSMFPTIQAQGEIVLLSKYVKTLQGGPGGEARAQLAQQKQASFEQQTGRVHEWYEPIVSVSDIPTPSVWNCLQELGNSTLSVGDVVVLHHPLRKGNVCKRILGLPGDQVIYGGSLLIVPDGHLWVEGDNPNNSSDSRAYGAIPASLVVGRVVLRIWPLRGQAWMTRGGRPKETAELPNSGGSVLPAGYEGQEIVKILRK